MKYTFIILATLYFFLVGASSSAATLVFDNEFDYLAALPTPAIVETFTADTGGLLPLVDVGTSFQVADDFLKFTSPPAFHLTNFLHSQEQFTSFGARFCQVPPGVFVVFADAMFVTSRLDPADHDFFIGVITDLPFDIFSLTHSTGSFNVATAYFTLVPEPSAMVMLMISFLLIIPTFTRGTR